MANAADADVDADHVVSSVEEETSLLRGQPAQGRKISWTSAYVLIISKIIGSGVFAAPGVVTQSAGSIGLSLLVWLLGAILAACGAAVSIEMGSMLPQSGGENIYLEYIYRRPRYLAISIISVKVLLQTSTAKNCLVFGEYLLQGLPVAARPGISKAAALGLLGFSAIMHGSKLIFILILYLYIINPKFSFSPTRHQSSKPPRLR